MERMTESERTLARENLGLVHYVLRQFEINGGEYDDYAQIGAIGLCKAASSYDASRCKFATYALHCIRNEILMELRKKACAYRAFGGITFSLDREVPGLTNGATYVDLFAAKEGGENTVAYFELMDRLRCELSEKQFCALMMTVQGYEQTEIGERLHVSQSYASRLYKAAREKLNDGILKEGSNHDGWRKATRGGVERQRRMVQEK